MTKTLITSFAALTLCLFAASTGAQDHSAHTSQASPVAQAFEHYEAVRKALAADTLADVAPHARELAASAEGIGGPEARKAADALVAAGTIEEARKHFGAVSAILVPKFQEAAIPGARAYMCGMKNQSWMQRGENVENPYYGKSMLTCGTPLTKKEK